MKALDRAILTTLALGIWALVLKPGEANAHQEDQHWCDVSGVAFGEVESGGDVFVYAVSGLQVECRHM